MAATKLTLSIEADTVDKAKKYALKHHTSVSKLFSDLINEITLKDFNEDDPFLKKLKEIQIPENIKSLTGILKGKVAEDVDLWDAKHEYLKDKYGL